MPAYNNKGVLMKKINWFQLIAIVLGTELIGLLGSLFSGITGQSYATLIKPPLSPPGWLFGLVWPVLYLLMAIADYLIYQTPPTPERQKATGLYWIQLFVNFLWPIVFFRFEWYWFSVAVILLLNILVIAAAIRFFKLEKAAGYLMIPYLLWLLFAAYLNIGVALLN